MNIFSRILYYLILIPLSLLPFGVLYIISDLLYYLFYYLIGYRKKVVLANIRNSFPEKTDDEINSLCKLFYRHLCDIVVESIKSFTISEKQILKRMNLLNPEIINHYFEKNQSVILAGGHYNNWEWIAVGAGLQMKHRAYALYKQLSNKFLDKKMQSTRGKYGLKMISTKNVKELFDSKFDKPIATIFAFDQSPSNPSKGQWIRFLNQDTNVLTGTERFAVKYNQPVLFGTINKLKRGYYQFRFQLITENPSTTSEGEITTIINKKLEEEILKAPQYWLWTHRKWKHKKQETN
jgi:KDO2-lipid IV(A) lauroyltransferase